MQFNQSFGLDELDKAIPIIKELLPVIIPVLLIALVLLIVSAVNLSKKKLPFRDKIIWLIVIIFVMIIGPAVYLLLGSKMLDNKESGKEEESI